MEKRKLIEIIVAGPVTVLLGPFVVGWLFVSVITIFTLLSNTDYSTQTKQILLKGDVIQLLWHMGLLFGLGVLWFVVLSDNERLQKRSPLFRVCIISGLVVGISSAIYFLYILGVDLTITGLFWRLIVIGPIILSFRYLLEQFKQT